jgi:hypothetical protein
MKSTSMLLAVLLTAAAFAQQPGAANSDTTHLAVVVTDDRGAPIRDLRSKDFGVEGGGKSQPGEMQVKTSTPIT